MSRIKANGAAGQAHPSASVKDAAGAALQVAQHYPVFPCQPGTKRPFTEHGFKDASQDPQVIRQWWRTYPEALVGVPTGAVSGLTVVDCDPKSGDWFQRHRERLGTFRLHQTRRGKHLLYRTPEGREIHNSTSQIAPGVDVRGEGGYVIWWPAHGGASSGELGAWPEWLNTPRVRKLNGHLPGEGSVDWAAERPRIIQALAQLDPDMDHDAWRNVAASLSFASGGTEDGEEVFIAFSRGDYASAKSTKFPGEAEVRKKYRSFKNNKEANVELGTLYQMVKDAKGKVPAGRPESKKALQFSARHLSAVQPTQLAAIQGMDIPEKRCLIGEWLKPGAWLVVGRPKIGKSWLLMQMLVDLRRGRRFVNYETDLREKEDLLAFFCEDDNGRLKYRSQAYGQMPPRGMDIYNREAFLKLAQACADIGDFPTWLDAYLGAHPATRVVVIDTEETTRFVWRTKELPRERSQRITVVDYEQTSRFDAIALRHGVAILLVNHSKKLHLKPGEGFDIHEIINRTNTALAGASGSIVIGDLPESDRLDPSEKRRLLGVRGRDVEEDVLVVLNRPQTRFVNEGVYQQVEQTLTEQELLTELREWHDGGDVGKGEFVGLQELARAIGKAHITVKQTVARMLKNGRTQWNGYQITTRRGRSGGIRIDKIQDKPIKRGE